MLNDFNSNLKKSASGGDQARSLWNRSQMFFQLSYKSRQLQTSDRGAWGINAFQRLQVQSPSKAAIFSLRLKSLNIKM